MTPLYFCQCQQCQWGGGGVHKAIPLIREYVVWLQQRLLVPQSLSSGDDLGPGEAPSTLLPQSQGKGRRVKDDERLIA